MTPWQGVAMGCSDLLLLQRLADGELDATQAQLVAHHLVRCPTCRGAARDLASVRLFTQEQLGREDDSEEEAAVESLHRVALRLSMPQRGSARLRRWRPRTWVAAAAAVLLVVLVPIPFGSRLGASPEVILAEAGARERMWVYQPNTVLHWQVETLSTGVKALADGRWRTLFWQNNGATEFAQISRQFDPEGRTTHAYWRQADGSVIQYNAKRSVVEVSPSTATAERALPTLTPELRAALDAALAKRRMMRTLDFQSRRDAEWLQRPSAGTSTLREGLLDGWGEVYHITIVSTAAPPKPGITRAEHEYTIQKARLRIVRLKSTITYTDGTVGMHDARWIDFREASAAEFDAQTPRDLLEGGSRFVHLTPREVAQRQLDETSPGPARPR